MGFLLTGIILMDHVHCVVADSCKWFDEGYVPGEEVDDDAMGR